MRIAITGGIGSGKSYVCRLLHERGISVFDCDTVAKRIIATDPTVREQLTALIGQPLSKATLGTYIRRGPDYAQRVNAIVHPRVAQAFIDSATTAASATVPEASASVSRQCGQGGPPATAAGEHQRAANEHQWMECAILFESGFDRLVDRIVVVTCPEDERIRRITARDNCDPATARRWLNLQTTDDERIARAHHVIINDSTTPLLPQIDALLTALAAQP